MSGLTDTLVSNSKDLAEYLCNNSELEIDEDTMTLIYRVAATVAKETIREIKNKIHNL